MTLTFESFERHFEFDSLRVEFPRVLLPLSMYRPDSSEYRQQQQKLDEEGDLGFFRTVFVSTGLFALFFVFVFLLGNIWEWLSGCVSRTVEKKPKKD